MFKKAPLKPAYDVVMDPEKNPLQGLPKTVRFQYLLILSYIWSAVFTIWLGSSVVLGPTVIGHSVLLIGVFFTFGLFRNARRMSASHRDAMVNDNDGTVLYDDIWGESAACRSSSGEPRPVSQ
jgi:hypothetical protein